MKNKFSIAMSLAMIVAMLVTSFALAAELVTAEVTGTGNDVTVTQGTSVTSSISLSATGSIACAITSGSPSTATVDTTYSLNSAGALTTGSPSSALAFYSDGVSVGGPNCGITWNGASTPYGVTATFSAAATTPVGDYTVALVDSAPGVDTTDVTNPAGSGGKLGDTTATTITVHVVAPVVTDNTPPVISYVLTPSLPDGSNGWYKSNVSLVWTVTDPESSVSKTGCVDQNIIADQAATTYSCSASSAGGSAAPVNVTIKRDATAPSGVSGAPERVPDNGTWYNHAVDVDFTGTDARSGVASCTTTNYSGPDGSAITVNGSCTDNAGNTSGSVASSSFNYDGSGPTGVVLTVTAGTPGSNGWYTSDVTVHTSSDADISGVTCTTDQFQTTETAGAVFNGSCTNGAGLTSNAASLTVKLDKTGPSAALAVTAGTAGLNGWYTSDVTVSTSGSDDISGPASCTVDQFQTTETTGQVFNGSCTNDAGLSTNAAPLTVKLDKTGPSAALSASGTLGNNGWYVSDVTIETSGSDTISDPTTCSANQLQTSDTASATFNGSCTNDAGLSTNAAPLTIKRDATAPTSVSFVGGPDAGGSYYFGSVPSASTCTADGAVSGLASCNVTGHSAAVGSHTMTATATDNAGNVGTATRSYTVLGWTIKGFYQPVDMFGVLNTVKGGSTVPLKFEVFAGPTELTDTAIVSTLLKQVTCNATAEDTVEVLATGGTSLRYDTVGGQFIYNWQTPKLPGKCYSVTLATQDGSSITALFKLK